MAKLEGSIQVWGQLSTDWASENPILLIGQIGFETDTNKLKIGDGSTAWNSLTYFGGSGGAWGSITGTLSDQIDLQAALDGKETAGAAAAALTAAEDYADTLNAYNLATLAVYIGQPRGILLGGVPTTGSGWLGSVWGAPYVVCKAHYVSHIRIRIFTGQAGSFVRLKLFDVDANGDPTTLLGESGAMDSSSSGLLSYEFSSPIALTKQMYVMGFETSNNAVSIMRGNTNAIPLFPRQTGALPTSNHSVTHTFGTGPSTFGTPNYLTACNTPLIEMIPSAFI